MNEVKIQELIEAIEKLSQKGWVDYLIIIVPIMLSVVALWISLATASKQNKIAMFEMRYKAINQLEQILGLEMGIQILEGNIQKEHSTTGKIVYDEKYVAEGICVYFDATYGTSITNQEPILAMKEATQALLTVRAEIVVLLLAADAKQAALIEDILCGLTDLITAAIDRRVDLSAREQLRYTCEHYSNSVHEKLLKKIKI